MNPHAPGNPVAVPARGLLEARSAPAGRGVDWLRAGFRSFVAEWPAWLGVVALSLLGSLLQWHFPLVGTFVVFLCTPVFIGGLMRGLQGEGGHRLAVSDLFREFGGPARGALLRIGLAWWALVLLALVACFVLVTLLAALDTLTALAQSEDMLAAARELTYGIGLLVSALVFVALLVPVTMAVWFAPALVVLEGEGAAAAMRHSFIGCLRNFRPFLAYGLVGLLLFPLLAALTLGLGLLVLLPVGLASIHAAYRDIFHRR